VLLVAFAGTSCRPGANGVQSPVEAVAILPPENLSLAQVSLRPGLAEYELTVGDERRSIAVSMPDGGDPGLVVVALHGAVPRGSAVWGAPAQTRGLLRCLIEPALRSLNPLIIAPRADDGEWWRSSNTRLVLGLTVAAGRRWPRLRRRVVVLGYSNGGIGAWYFARLYPQYFAAAIPMASNDTVVGETPIPVFAIHGSNDELFSSDLVHDAVERLSKRGRDVTFIEKYRGTHLAPCSYVHELSLAGGWLDGHVLMNARRAPE
jgi:hypothetical protein